MRDVFYVALFLKMHQCVTSTHRYDYSMDMFIFEVQEKAKGICLVER